MSRKTALNRGVVALLLVAAACCALAQAPGKPPEIEYASPDQSVWTTRLNAKGEPDNPLLRVAQVLFAKTGHTWHNKAYPAARLFRNLQDGNASFSILVKSPLLQECCLYSRKSLTTVEIRVYHLPGLAPIRSRDDLRNKSVVVIAGYTYGGLLSYLNDTQNRIDLAVSATHGAAFKMLASGRADYLVEYAGPAAEVLAGDPISGVESDLLTRQEVYLVLSKRYPDAPQVMTRLERVAETLDVEALMKAPR